MRSTAAVLVETGQPLVLAELDFPALKPGQVIVEIAFSGVCHTQLLEARGFRGEDRFLPHCLGHEGSGVVVETGSGVTKVKEGDRVILSWIKGSGADIPGSVYRWQDRDVNAGAITTFSRHSVISENRLTVLPEEVGLREACLLGCAVPTGVGAVLNTAAPKPGQSIVIFGAGGIGLSATAGAAISGCTPIVLVDVRKTPLDQAKLMGATHFINASQADAAAEIQRLIPGGADFAVEATGRPPVMAQSLECVRPQGGVAVIIGNAHYGENVDLDPRQFNLGKQLKGTWGGDNQPDTDYPRYCRLISSGRLDVGPLLSNPYPLTEINRALDDLESGKVTRPIIKMAAK